MTTFEVNFDGLVGPTHNYAGLAYGNFASMSHGNQISNPRAAALQGLKKMQRLMQLGLKQAILPPHPRPNLDLLRSLGFQGSEREVLEKTFHASKDLFRASYSSSSMWVANAATVTPSQDNGDGRLHLTVSNLVANVHRTQEAAQTYHVLKKIFSNEKLFKVHPPLLACRNIMDEGAANQNRFCKTHAQLGFQMLVYGREGFAGNPIKPIKYPARQTKEASLAIARRHQLNPDQVLFVQQNPAAIDHGVFHNDVISVVNENVFLYHEDAFVNTNAVIEELKSRLTFPVFFIPVLQTELTFEEAVQSYLFNSQIVTLPSSKMLILAPEEVQAVKPAFQVLQRIIADDNPIESYELIDCRQSMQNGGGPACLRLRVVMTEAELTACHQGILLTGELYTELENWILKYYRDKLSLEDLLDKQFLEESKEALDELTKILKLGSIYPFQITNTI